MATVARKMTVDEFLAMDLGEGTHELVRGEIVEMPPAEYFHGFVCVKAAMLLHLFNRDTGHGYLAVNDSAVWIDAHTVRGADVSYYSQARWPESEVGKGRPPVPPDLIVEVVSPGNRPGELLQKVADYLAVGVAMVWLLNPKRSTLTIYRAGETDPILLGATDVVENLPELPGFRCHVAEFFG